MDWLKKFFSKVWNWWKEDGMAFVYHEIDELITPAMREKIRIHIRSQIFLFLTRDDLSGEEKKKKVIDSTKELARELLGDAANGIATRLLNLMLEVELSQIKTTP